MFDNFSPIVIVLLAIMVLSLVMTFMSKKISDVIEKKHQGDYNMTIKLIGLLIITLLSVTIIFIIRG